MTKLRLIALDEDDLQVISAHLQDAVMRVGDMTYLPRDQRFAVVLNRFNWEQAIEQGEKARHQVFERRRAGLHFDRVTATKTLGIDQSEPDTVLELLAVKFEETDAPAGVIELDFAGGPTIRLEVECIEASLMDLGAAWETSARPEHTDETDAGTAGEQ